MCRTCHEVPVAPPRSACEHSTGVPAPLPSPTGLPRPTDVPRCVSRCSLQPSRCPRPVCSAPAPCAALSPSPSCSTDPALQESRSTGGWLSMGVGSSRDTFGHEECGFRGCRGGARCQLRSREEGQCSLSTPLFQCPLPGTRSSPAFPSTFIATTAQCQPGGSHPPAAPSPWAALLLPTPVLLDSQLGAAGSAATPTSSKTQGLRPLGDSTAPAAPRKGTGDQHPRAVGPRAHSGCTSASHS